MVQFVFVGIRGYEGLTSGLAECVCGFVALEGLVGQRIVLYRFSY